MKPESQLYSPDELNLQRIGARLILEKLLGVVRQDWSGSGTKLWAERQLEELDG